MVKTIALKTKIGKNNSSMYVLLHYLMELEYIMILFNIIVSETVSNGEFFTL